MTIRIKINNQPAEVQEETTMKTVADERQLPEKGVAVAVNNEMLPRGEWGGYVLKDGDDIVILKAFCGG